MNCDCCGACPTIALVYIFRYMLSFALAMSYISIPICTGSMVNPSRPIECTSQILLQKFSSTNRELLANSDLVSSLPQYLFHVPLTPSFSTLDNQSLASQRVPITLADTSPFHPLASWNWNGSTPGGQVAEKKSEGEVAIQSKRGNTIKKDAKPGDPAIHLERPGNDVVKNQSELQVDEKKASGDKGDNEGEEKKTEEPNGTNGTKRKADDEPEAEGDDEEKAQPSAKKAKAGRPKAAEKEKKEKAPPKKKAEKEEKPEAAAADAGADGPKKSRGRPKGGAKKEKKAPAPPTGVGKRTRSNK